MEDSGGPQKSPSYKISYRYHLQLLRKYNSLQMITVSVTAFLILLIPIKYRATRYVKAPDRVEGLDYLANFKLIHRFDVLEVDGAIQPASAGVYEIIV